MNLGLIAQLGAAEPGGPLVMLVQFLPILLVFLIFYFLVIRPQSQKQKELQKQIAALKKGDRVVTTGGVLGDVVDLKDTTAILKVADNVKMEFTKQSIVGVLSKAQ